MVDVEALPVEQREHQRENRQEQEEGARHVAIHDESERVRIGRRARAHLLKFSVAEPYVLRQLDRDAAPGRRRSLDLCGLGRAGRVDVHGRRLRRQHREEPEEHQRGNQVRAQRRNERDSAPRQILLRHQSRLEEQRPQRTTEPGIETEQLFDGADEQRPQRPTQIVGRLAALHAERPAQCLATIGALRVHARILRVRQRRPALRLNRCCRAGDLPIRPSSKSTGA